MFSSNLLAKKLHVSVELLLIEKMATSDQKWCTAETEVNISLQDAEGVFQMVKLNLLGKVRL